MARAGAPGELLGEAAGVSPANTVDVLMSALGHQRIRLERIGVATCLLLSGHAQRRHRCLQSANSGHCRAQNERDP